jgi:hypothetical protein
VFGLRHHFLGILAADPAHDFGGIRFSGNDGDLPRFPFDKRTIPVNERDSARFFDAAMAGGAMFQEDGSDIPVETHWPGVEIGTERIQAQKQAGYFQYSFQNDVWITWMV